MHVCDYNIVNDHPVMRCDASRHVGQVSDWEFVQSDATSIYNVVNSFKLTLLGGMKKSVLQEEVDTI